MHSVEMAGPCQSWLDGVLSTSCQISAGHSINQSIKCAMATTYAKYNVASEIEAFFTKTCDARALELASRNTVPVISKACAATRFMPVLNYNTLFNSALNR
ncbi:hypothetical protein F4823DRAFT_580059 [Ustulina deusta]|nr:hypothetical protein F4823DRAFT_580059 [Ustulina deusta]